MGILDVRRKFEFAPIKNADVKEGIAVDSPASARELLLNESKQWLARAGHPFDQNHRLFVSPLVSYEGEGLEDVKIPEASDEILEITKH